MYAADLWHTGSLTPTGNTNASTDDDQHQHQQHQRMITLKPVGHEPVSPLPALVHDIDNGKPVATIHRRPLLIAFNDSDACSTSRPNHFECTQCHETSDSILLGQENANRGMCTTDAPVHVSPI